jgi:hypothetical protein
MLAEDGLNIEPRHTKSHCGLTYTKPSVFYFYS